MLKCWCQTADVDLISGVHRISKVGWGRGAYSKFLSTDLGRGMNLYGRAKTGIKDYTKECCGVGTPMKKGGCSEFLPEVKSNKT